MFRLFSPVYTTKRAKTNNVGNVSNWEKSFRHRLLNFKRFPQLRAFVSVSAREPAMKTTLLKTRSL